MKVNHYSLGLSQMFDSNPSFDLFQREVHEFAGNLRGGAHLPTPHFKIQQCFTDKNVWSRAFFKDFPVGGGGAFFEKGPFCEIIY